MLKFHSDMAHCRNMLYLLVWGSYGVVELAARYAIRGDSLDREIERNRKKIPQYIEKTTH